MWHYNCLCALNMWNKITAISSISWTVSRSTLASYHRCCQRNRRWVLTTGSDGRTLLRTVVNTCFMTTVPFCWRGLTPGPTGGRINIKWTYFFYLEREYLPCSGGFWRGSECGNSDANFLTVSSSNCGSILLSFRDMTTGWTTNIPTLAIDAYLAIEADQQ